MRRGCFFESMGGISPCRCAAAARHRIQLRMDLKSGGPVLVLPRYASIERGFEFARDKRAWIGEQIALQPEFFPSSPARSSRSAAATMRSSIAAGPAGRQPRGDLARARRDLCHRRGRNGIESGRGLPQIRGTEQICRRAHEKAELTGKHIRRISLRDPKSRWGSCTSTGNLSFSWRLVMAPTFVLD